MRRGAAAPARGLPAPRKRRRGEPAAGAQQAGVRQGALRQRISRSGDRRRAYVPFAAPSGRLALPAGPRLGPRSAPPRLDGIQSGRSADPAPLPGIRRAVRRHAARRDPLQGLRTDVRTLRRAALHRGVQRLGHRLQDRQVEYLAARQLVPALRRDDARQYGGQRSRSRTHRTAGRAEIRGQPRTGDVRHPRRRRAERQFAFYSDRIAERGRLAGAARAGRVGHRRGPLVVPDPERTGLCFGIQRRTHPARVRSGPQHGHPR